LEVKEGWKTTETRREKSRKRRKGKGGKEEMTGRKKEEEKGEANENKTNSRMHLGTDTGLHDRFICARGFLIFLQI
jgi:hypothetical protein